MLHPQVCKSISEWWDLNVSSATSERGSGQSLFLSLSLISRCSWVTFGATAGIICARFFYEILNKYINLTFMFVCVFVSETNKFPLNSSSQSLTLPAVHFCPITNPHLAQQESRIPWIKPLSLCGKTLMKGRQIKRRLIRGGPMCVNGSDVVKTR